jgi:hypothetical protein
MAARGGGAARAPLAVLSPPTLGGHSVATADGTASRPSTAKTARSVTVRYNTLQFIDQFPVSSVLLNIQLVISEFMYRLICSKMDIHSCTN